MALYDLVIKEGLIVAGDDEFIGDLAIAGESIAAFGRGLHGRREIEAGGLWVLPGGVDAHVHLQMPSGDFLSADDFSTGSRAALLGGTTTFIDFVEPPPGQSLLAALADRRSEADGASAADYSFHMTLSDPVHFPEIPQVIQAGIPSFKLYMTYDGLLLPDDQLLQAMECIARAGGLALIHAENHEIIKCLTARCLAEEKTAPQWHYYSRPEVMEGEACRRAIALAELAQMPLCLAHLSCRQGLEAVREAKARGLHVFGETCPQYLALEAAVYEEPFEQSSRFVCAPPLRPKEHQEALWKGISEKTIDIISTDHCPFTMAQKARGKQDFSRIPGGVPGIETRLVLLHHLGVSRGRLDRRQWAEICAAAPARLYGLAKKGALRPGYDADIVLFDPHKEVPLEKDNLHSAIDYSIYDTMTTTGYPVMTLLRGKVVTEDGRFTGEGNEGRFCFGLPPVFSRNKEIV